MNNCLVKKLNIHVDNGVKADELIVPVHKGTTGQYNIIRFWGTESLLVSIVSGNIKFLSGEGGSELEDKTISVAKEGTIYLSNEDGVIKLSGIKSITRIENQGAPKIEFNIDTQKYNSELQIVRIYDNNYITGNLASLDSPLHADTLTSVAVGGSEKVVGDIRELGNLKNGISVSGLYGITGDYGTVCISDKYKNFKNPEIIFKMTQVSGDASYTPSNVIFPILWCQGNPNNIYWRKGRAGSSVNILLIYQGTFATLEDAEHYLHDISTNSVPSTMTAAQLHNLEFSIYGYPYPYAGKTPKWSAKTEEAIKKLLTMGNDNGKITLIVNRLSVTNANGTLVYTPV